MQKPVTTFLCHSTGDKSAVRDLHRRLKSSGISPWLDEIDIRPGEDWQSSIANAVRSSDTVLVCLSATSIAKTGYVQKEIAFALDRADEQPEGQIYIVPVRLEPCIVPQRLSRWQWVDLFAADGFARLVSSLTSRDYTPTEPSSEITEFPPFNGVVHGGPGLLLCKRCERFFPLGDKTSSCSHHTEPPEKIGTTGPEHDYADVWRFACCGKTVMGPITARGNDMKPLVSPGCARSMHLPYEA